MTPPGAEARAVAPAGVGALRHWWAAVRPHTLTLAVVPVLLGSGLGWTRTGSLEPWLMTVALLAAVLIQAATNLHNDAADFASGADDPATRLGPPRASALGWLSVDTVRRAAQLGFALATLLGAYLVWAGGWFILLIGIASIAAGWAYSGGPRPLAYTPLGELCVLVFFGLVAVAGSYFLQTGSVSVPALLAGAVVGMPAAAVLVVNNLRDVAADRRAGRRTVAVLLGERASCVEYTLLVLAPFPLLRLVDPALAGDRLGWLPWLALPWALLLARRLWRQPYGRSLNGLLGATARFQAVLGLALCVALWQVHTPG